MWKIKLEKVILRFSECITNAMSGVKSQIQSLGFFFFFFNDLKKKMFAAALAGNRTRASRVAGENSTTEPPMLQLSAAV